MTLRLENNIAIMKFSAIVFVFSTASNSLNHLFAARTFRKTRVCSSDTLCADEVPSVILDADQLTNSTMNSSSYSYYSNSCKSFGVLCSWECASDPDLFRAIRDRFQAPYLATIFSILNYLDVNRYCIPKPSGGR